MAKKYWLNYVHGEVYSNWLDHTTKARDIPVLLKAKWRWVQDTGRAEKGYTEENCLLDILEALRMFGLDNVAQAGEEWYCQ